MKATQTNIPLGFTVTKVLQSQERKLKKSELKLDVAVAGHSSVSTLDHVAEIIKAESSCYLKDLRLHRMKCAKLIMNVIAPCLKQEMLADLARRKHLCLCLKYFSEDDNKIKTALLALSPVVETSGEALFTAVRGALCDAALQFTDCMGYFLDSTSNVVGEFNSL